MDDNRPGLALNRLTGPGQRVKRPAVHFDRRKHRWQLRRRPYQIADHLPERRKIAGGKRGQFAGRKGMAFGHSTGSVHRISRTAKSNAHLIRFGKIFHESDSGSGPAETNHKQPFGKRIQGTDMADFSFAQKAPQTGNDRKRR
jgi:hypothetical protein